MDYVEIIETGYQLLQKLFNQAFTVGGLSICVEGSPEGGQVLRETKILAARTVPSIGSFAHQLELLVGDE